MWRYWPDSRVLLSRYSKYRTLFLQSRCVPKLDNSRQKTKIWRPRTDSWRYVKAIKIILIQTHTREDTKDCLNWEKYIRVKKLQKLTEHGWLKFLWIIGRVQANVVKVVKVNVKMVGKQENLCQKTGIGSLGNFVCLNVDRFWIENYIVKTFFFLTLLDRRCKRRPEKVGWKLSEGLTGLMDRNLREDETIIAGQRGVFWGSRICQKKLSFTSFSIRDIRAKTMHVFKRRLRRIVKKKTVKQRDWKT